MRYDLAFFLCCCKSCLGADEVTDGGDFYTLLGIERDATAEEIKKAYKRRSLQMHPDKLAQRGQAVTEEDQAKFTRMKEAYEILSDPHKRETYDAIGERGMKWVEEPFSMDPQELVRNFAKSLIRDRCKLFAFFVGIAVAVLLLPVLICLHVDGAFGEDASWLATLVPLWLWDCFILFYHSRVILMGPTARPEHIPPEEWVDPLPMKKRIFSLCIFMLIVLFEILVALKLDGIVTANWTIVFIPLYALQAEELYKRWSMARMRIVTVEDLETALGKPFAEFTTAEKELMGKRYSVVPSTTSPEFKAAQKLKARARRDIIINNGFRILFVIVLLIQIDGYVEWSWWLIFTPVWISSFLICYRNAQIVVEVQNMAAEKDPTLFGVDKNGNKTPGAANYGAVGNDGDATPDAASKPELSEEEREELKAKVMATRRSVGNKKCCQVFELILMFLFVGKLQGAGFSSLWIISPFLLTASIFLCCLGCGMLIIGGGPTDGVDFDTGDLSGDSNTEPDNANPTIPSGTNYTPPTGAEQSPSGPDLESGEGRPGNKPEGTVETVGAGSNSREQQTKSTPVDLLDDAGQGSQPNGHEEISELD